MRRERFVFRIIICRISLLIFSVLLFQVTGVVVDKNGSAKWVLQGSWDGKIEASRVVNGSNSNLKSKPVLETSTPKILWKKNHPL